MAAVILVMRSGVVTCFLRSCRPEVSRKGEEKRVAVAGETDRGALPEARGVAGQGCLLKASIIHLPLVLVLNRAWGAINVRTVGLAVQQMMAGSATALDVDPEGGTMRPVRWPARPS